MKVVAALLALLFAGCATVTRQAEGRVTEAAVVPYVDHLVYATPDLDSTIDLLERKLGVRAVHGGQHPGGGTRNALISMGHGRYLEIFAPDPAQPEPRRPRPFGLDQLKEPRLVSWLAVGRDLPALRARAVAAGVPLGEVISGSRKRPDGVQIAWQFTDPWVSVGDGIVPPFIDWLGSPHPSAAAPGGLELIGLRAEHPSPGQIRPMLQALGLPLRVDAGPGPQLVATLSTPRGVVELR